MPPDKKKLPVSPGVSPMEELIFVLGGLLLLGVILTQLTSYLGSIGWGTWETSGTRILDSWFYPFWPTWKIIAVVLTAVCTPWAIYSIRKIIKIEEEEQKMFGSPKEESLLEELTEDAPKEKENEKWVKVTEHAHSENPSDWRLAIIEADVMLEEALRLAGYHGDGVGEMLKSAEPGDMQNLDVAWEAHKVRNRIAHDGSDFQLNSRETRRTIELFEAVLIELGVI
ncbi:MAG: hypothetical protein Q7R67_01350 [bacterium]|nr:hypothetical protein [bacterium]